MAQSSDANDFVDTFLYLPGEEWVVQTWKCEEGSLVLKGETVALVCLKDSFQALGVASASADSSSSSHKRPSRRRRIAPIVATASNSQSLEHVSRAPFVATSGTDPIVSIQQRLVSKLSSEKRDEGVMNKVASSSSGSATASSARASDTPSQRHGLTGPKPIVAQCTGLFRKATENTYSGTGNSLVIGSIEACSHPAFLEGVCVVCGVLMVQRRNDDAEDDEGTPTKVPLPSFESSESHDQLKTSQVTVSGGITMTISAEESREMARRDADRLVQQAKLALVLDLDHTLVHATADPRARQFFGQEDLRTLRLPAMEGAQNQAMLPSGAPAFMQHYVKLRPHIRTFLERVQPDYELTVYTAGTRRYAEEITVVLCRHMVGSRYDIDDLERLRYNVDMARMEYEKVQSLNETTTKFDENAESNVTDCEGPAKKRKKVSFGARSASDNDDWGGDQSRAAANSYQKSDHITKETLEALEGELANAEELEKKALDLRQKLFGSRVVSRTDVGDLGRDVKSLKRIFPCGGTMAAVLDDREDVWANATDNSVDTIKGEPPDNLLLVRPYHWQPFSGFADVNNAAGDDPSRSYDGKGEVDDPRVEKDVQLVWTSRILKGLHRRFYRQDMNNRKSVPELLAEMRYRVLDDVTMVLSGLVPLNKKSLGVQEARPPIIRYAQSLGAKVGCSSLRSNGSSPTCSV
jgi:RNA polymerase II subunit A C-terminal domain phosphatase